MVSNLSVRLNRLARWKSNIIHTLGLIEIALGLMLIVPTAVALAYGEDWTIFAVLMPVLLILGFVQYFIFYSDGKMQPSTGILLIAMSWFIAFAVVSVPYLLYGFHWYDAIFESVSGFTAAGATIVPDVEILPKSILFWRSFSQWVGGLAVVLMFMFMIPMMGIGGRAFLNNELLGTDVANYSIRMKSIAKSFILIYLLLSILEVVLLSGAGVNLFESTCMTMSNISTGGLMVKNDSITSYSFMVQLIVLVFMFLGGTNFYLHYRVIYKREYSAYVKSQEFVGTVVWFAFVSILVSAAVLLMQPGVTDSAGSAANAIWGAIFTTVSFGTSTGYVITDYSMWPAAVMSLLLLVGMIGSMSGSTGGGIKLYRLMIVKSYVMGGLYKMIHPHAIKEAEFDGAPVSGETVTAVIVVLLSFVGAFAVGMVAFLFTQPGIGLMESMGLCVASLGNVGSGFGTFGPSGTLADLTVASKLLMAGLIWVGRLEVFMVLIMFTKPFWKDVSLNFSRKGRGENESRAMPRHRKR
ncbi:MAG: TrkH family potassium uptake protein [Candidatus Methanomethylophilaceae archaeon]|nr:TrkH family potassium uptake protein [Candidatus Methanomethylophilaceae archaeon]